MNLKELHEKKIKDLLDKIQILNLPLLEREANIEEVFSVLTSRDHVWITDEKNGKKLVGIITESDVLHSLAPQRLPKYVFSKRHGISLQHGTVKTAGDIMHKRLITCSPTDSVGEILRIMINSGLRRLPVIENEEIVGEVTIHHILQIVLGKR